MNGARRIQRLVALVVFPALLMGLGGCTAFALANRGAPEGQMRTFEVELSAANLDEHTVHGEGHDPATVGDPTLIQHDHNDPNHDIDEHLAFLEQQAALESEGEVGADPAMAPPAEHGVVLEPYWIAFPEDGWIHGFEFELTDGNGRGLPTEILHHLQVLVPNRRELFSPVMLRVAGAGGETRATSVPRQVGYPIAEGDSLIFTAMLHNPTGRPLGNVRLKVGLSYSPENRSWEPPADVVPFFTHVTEAFENTAYDLPPGRSEKTLEVWPAVSGQVLGIGGHLHRYGESLRVEDAATGEVLWEAEPVRGPDGTVLEVPEEIFVWGGSFDLVAGHGYRITAVYDNPTGRTIPEGGMGTIGGVIRPRGDWPDVDPKDAEYLWDLEKMLGGGSTAGHETHAAH